MKKIVLLMFALAVTFTLGFGFNSFVSNNSNNSATMKRVTGIGGIFFKCKDPAKVREWYKTHLGLQTNEYGSVFEWRQATDSSKKGFSQWSPFRETTKYFAPSTKEFMINYRVENLEVLVEVLKKEGVTVTDTIQTYDYGKFVHIMDPENNKIELWEANDIEFEKLGIQIGATTTK
jgi:predicted enzyme related to lactoylglutathione lyase